VTRLYSIEPSEHWSYLFAEVTTSARVGGSFLLGDAKEMNIKPMYI